MSVGMRGAWAAEAHVARVLRNRGWFVVPLAPSFPCDLLAVTSEGTDRALHWIEVKSAKTRSRLRSNLLTPEEAAFLAERETIGDSTLVVWVLRLPGGKFEMFEGHAPPVVRRGRKTGEKERDFSGGRRSART